MCFHATITSMRKLERRVAYGEAPSVADNAMIHSFVGIKRTPKPNVIRVTADDRRGDSTIPIPS